MALPNSEEIAAMMNALRNYPPNGKPDLTDAANVRLREFGLIEECHTKKRCGACGAERPDHYWYAITPAGRLFMELNR
jgi:hypothetical protein